MSQEIKDILFESENIHKMQIELEKLPCGNETIVDVILKCLGTIDTIQIINETVKQSLYFIGNNKKERGMRALTVASVMLSESKGDI
jgi:hypothetical protein